MPEPPPGFVREGSAPPATPATLAQAGPSLEPTPVEPAPPAAKLAAPVVGAPATDGQPVGPVVPVPQEQGLEEGKPPRWRQDLAEVGPALQENLIGPAKRVGQQAIAGMVMAPAMAATNLVKNAAGLAAKGAEAISQATGIPSGGAFHAIEQDMTRRMAVGGQQLEALGGEPQGVVENVVRATGELVGRAPEFAVAHSLGGLLGLAGLGALSKADQGAQAAAEEGMTYATLGAAAKGAPELFAKLESLANSIKESAWWRGMTIKERGLVVQSLDETIAKNPEMTEAAILRKWNNPTWRKQALERRAEGEAGAAQAEPAMAPASAQEPMPPRSQEPASAAGAAISPEPMPMPAPAPESPPGANLSPRTAYPAAPLQAPQEVATLDKLRLEMAAKDALLEESGGLGLPGPAAPQSEAVPTPGGASGPQPGLAQPGPVSMGGDSSSPARPAGAPSLSLGEPTRIFVAGRKEPYPGHYAVMELGDIQTSHLPDTFAKNPLYPEGVQERDYAGDKHEQMKVIDHAQNLETAYLLTNNPDAINGPSIVTPQGVALGGNSRAMSLARAYAGDKGPGYKADLQRYAPFFGLESQTVAGMDRPVLVRVFDPGEAAGSQDLHRYASEFNQSPAQELGQEARTASLGNNISDETLQSVGTMLGGSEGSLRELLDSPKVGLTVLNRLVEDGAISQTQVNRYWSTKHRKLNAEGKTLVERAILGSMLPDVDVLNFAPESILNKISTAIPPLARVKAAEGSDFTADLEPAVRIIMEAEAKGGKSTRDWEQALAKQQGLEPRTDFYTPRQVQLAIALKDMGPNQFREAVKGYAADTAANMFGQGADPIQAFAKNFGEPPAWAGQLSPAQEQTPPPGAGQGGFGFADRGGYADLPPETQGEQAAISFTGNEFGAPGKVEPRTIRQRALEFVRRHLWGVKISNPALQEPIVISRPGIMKSLSDPKKAFLLARLPELLEKGAYQGAASPRKGEANIRQYHYLRQEIQVGGQTREVVLTIREANNGLFYYDNYLTKTVEGSPESQAASAKSGLRSGPAVGEPSGTNMAGAQAKVKPRGGGQADHGGYAATPPPGGGGPAAGGPAGTSKVSPLEGPELLELSQAILGQTPRVRRILRKKTALGVFYPGDGRIELAAKIFEKPSDALKTLAHEIGHAVDWLPDKDMRRGNLLGRVASLKKHIERFMAGKPGGPGPLTPADEARLRVEAERLLTKQPQVVEKEIDEEITRTLAITPDEVLAIFNDVTGQIKQTAPDLYRYVAGLGTAEKKSIVKAALKGQVRADLQQFAQTITEKTGRKIKTTTTIPGKAPLKKDIEKKFRELVQDEIRKRALLSEKVIREELKKLTQVWKPFNPALDKRYTSYRHSGPELYADALSVLLNRPDLLQRHAPEFYRGFFAYLGEKPAVKAIYDEIQARLRDPERVMEARQAREEAGFAAAEAKRRQALEAERKGVIKNWIVKSFVDTFGEVYGLSAKATGIRSGDTPLVRAHEKARLASAEVEAYYRKVYQEVMEPIQDVAPDLNKTGSIMLLQRVMGERGKVANPGAESMGTARRRLDYLRQQLGDEAYTTILERLEHFNELRQERVITVAEKAGIWSPELMAKAKGNNFYARFEVVDYMLQHQVLGPASGKIYRQWGTLKQVGNPLVATMLGDAGIINASRWTMATKELVKTLGRHFPDEIHPARRGTGGLFQEPRDRTGWGLVRYLDHGKPMAFEVTKTYADMYKRNPVMADAAVRLLNEFSSIPRSLYTGRNPLFWVFNLIKDFRDNLINLPGGPLEVWKLAPKYAEGLRHAYRAAADKPDALYDYLLRNHYLMPAYAAGSPGDDVALDTITRELTRRGIMKPSSSTTNPVLRPLAKVWDFLGAVGEAQSRTSKIAAHLYLKKHFPNLPEETQAYIVRNFAADPPYYRKGDWTPFVNSIWLFSNPAIQGYRRGVQAAFFSAEQAKAAGKSPWLSDFGLKFTLYGLMPKLFMWAVKYGLIGAGLVAMARNEEDKARAKQVADRLQKAMWGASKYNLVNYDIVPIPVPGKDGGVDFELLRIPKDHLSQFAGGIIWNFLDAASGDPRFKLPDALGYAADQAPDMNPVFSIPHNLWKIYIDRINPQDDFRGKSLIPEKAFEAGGLHLHGEVGRYIFNELSPVKLASGQQVEKADKDALDKAKEIPGLGPFVSKFMIDKEQGWRETYRAETEGTRSAKAGRQLDINERITALVNEHGGQVPRSAVAQLRRDAIDQGLLDPKTVSVGEMVKRVQKVAARAGEDRRLEALQAAGSNEERAALLRRYRQEMDEGAYRELMAAARRQKAVTKDTMRKLRQAGGE